MEEVLELEHLSLVSRICTELDNHLGMNDKDLAEFIIHLAEKNTEFNSFKKVLIENGAEFPDSFVSNLLRIIQLMKTSKSAAGTSFEADGDDKKGHLEMKFPGLAIPNKAPKEMFYEDEHKDVKDANMMKTVADDMMDELEALAPKSSNTGESAKSVEKRDRSRDRRRRSVSRERKVERHRRRSRSNSRDRRRSHSRDRRRRSRSRDGDRHRDRDRSRDRQRDRDTRRKRSRLDKSYKNDNLKDFYTILFSILDQRTESEKMKKASQCQKIRKLAISIQAEWRILLHLVALCSCLG